MGDRAVVSVSREGKDNVNLYTHWGGCEILEDVANALLKRERWDDHSYLTRIIFCEMVKDNIDGTTGFGIDGGESYDPGDRGIIKVDTSKATVKLPDGQEFTFKKFISDPENWKWYHDKE